MFVLCRFIIDSGQRAGPLCSTVVVQCFAAAAAAAVKRKPPALRPSSAKQILSKEKKTEKVGVKRKIVPYDPIFFPPSPLSGGSPGMKVATVKRPYCVPESQTAFSQKIVACSSAAKPKPVEEIKMRKLKLSHRRSLRAMIFMDMPCVSIDGQPLCDGSGIIAIRKGIVLSVDTWTRLVSQIPDIDAAIRSLENKNAPESDPKMFKLTQKKFVTIAAFHGTVLLDVAEYILDSKNKLKRGAKGITLNVDEWKRLKSCVEAIDKKLHEFRKISN